LVVFYKQKAMKIVRIVLFGLFGLVLLYLIFALLGPSQARVERSITIDAPQDVVWEYVNSLQDMEEWNPWVELDTAMEASYSGEPGAVGSTYSWVSDSVNVGVGTQTITQVIPKDSIITEREFEGMGTSTSWVRLEANSADQTTVSWGLYSEFPFLARPALLFMDLEEAITRDYDKGLAELKEWVESDKINTQKTYDVRSITFPRQNYVVQSDTISFQDMSAHFDKVGAAIHGGMQSGSISATGTLVGMYYNWDTETMKSHMAIGVPTDQTTAPESFELITLEEQPALQIDYYGPYEGTGPAHNYMEQYANKDGLTLSAPAIERYVTDPTKEPDTTKWLTEVIYPLQLPKSTN